MARIKFEDHEFDYDTDVLKRYSVIKKLSNYQNSPAGFFDSLDLLFGGRADEYAEKLGDDLEKVSELFAAIMEKQGGEAKN